MELRHLNYFLVLADELHFRKAAERLFIAQPPLSRQIKLLEEELGVLLFKRNNKKVELTEYGKYLKKESERIFADLHQVKQNLEFMKSSEAGKICIGYVGAVMHSFLPEVLKKLKLSFPEVHFILKELDNQSQLDGLKKNTIDLGFIRTPYPMGAIQSMKILTSSFSVIISETHPLAREPEIKLKMLKSLPFISFSKECAPSMHSSILSIFRKNRIEPGIVHQTSQINALLRLVESGFGFSIVPSDVRQGYKLGIKFYDLKDYPENTEISIIYNNDYVSNLAAKIIDSIKKQFADESP